MYLRHYPILLFCLIALTSCDYMFPNTWHYKITVEVETPEGLKTGSAVREVQMGKNAARFLNPDVGKAYYSVKGEAVVVDLGERGVFFALIKWNSFNEFFNAFPFDGVDYEDKVNFYNNIKIGKTAELKEELPRFVTFTDISDPMTVKPIDKTRMDEVFGKDVKLNGITIEITHDPVTAGEVEKWLPWINGIKSNLDGTSSTFSNRLSNVLHVGNFKRGG